MTPAEAFREVLERIGASNGTPVLVSDDELQGWPESAVQVMKKAELLTPASPASSAVCPGCEQECQMPVHTRLAGPGEIDAFIVCDKRDDINRVAVPEANLRQWSASLPAFGGLVARLFGITSTGAVSGQRCEIGVLRGRKHSSHVVLVSDGSSLRLHLAGHILVLADYLTLESKFLRLDKQAILKLVDRPVAGAGGQESARQRRERLTKLVQSEKARGNKAFLKTVAESEGISSSRLKQIVREKPKKTLDVRYPRY